MNSRKKQAMFFFTMLIVVISGLSAYGAAKREKIPTLKLRVECKERPEAGKEIGEVKVTTVNDMVEVAEEAYYYNTEDDVWIRGEIPVIRVEFSVKDAEKYYFTSSTRVSVSGAHGELKSKRIVDGGAGMQVEIRLRKAGGNLEEPEELEWYGNTAQWSEVEGAVDYEVKLYRGSVQVVTKKVRNCEYDFYPYMTRAGDYTFRVRALGKSEDERGKWSDKSEEAYIGKDDIYRGTPPSDSPAGSGTSGTNAGGIFGESPNFPLLPTGWVQDQTGWRFYFANHQPAQNTWIFVDNNWFFIDAAGYMMTDWIYVDNNWFYLNPISDGTRGAMQTGWQVINGNTYFLNPISDGTRGAMRTGYQNVDGNWYYFDSEQGFLWKNQNVPNGRWADENGILR